MPDAGRQIWEIRVPKDFELSPLKNRSEQEQNKNIEKGIEKKKWPERQWKMILSWNDPWSNHPETQFELTCPFFRNPEPRPTLHTWKSILIERGYLDRRVFFFEKFFIINKAVVSFPQPTKNLDQSFTCSGWILNCQVHNRTVKNEWKKWKWKEKITLGWKPERAV